MSYYHDNFRHCLFIENHYEFPDINVCQNCILSNNEIFVYSTSQ